MKVVLAGAMIAAMTLVGCGTTGSDRSRDVKKDSGKVQIGQIYMTMSDCTAAPFSLKITKQGDHGFAMIEKSKAKIKVADTVSGKVDASCAGESIAAKRVVYIPNLDYSGSDTVKVYYVNDANSAQSKEITYSINVK
jgi:hypothetical protein